MTNVHSFSSASNDFEKVTNNSKLKQQGFTLIELLVALAVSTLVTLAAFSALIISRQGLTAVDAASQLRDNARFATDLMQRIAVQAGYLSDRSISNPKETNIPLSSTSTDDICLFNLAPDVCGFNNSLVLSTSPTGLPTTRPTGSTDGSDILILRYQANEISNIGPTTLTTDGSMIDCSGNSITSPASNRQDRQWSVFHVALGADGEPSLYCSVLPSIALPIPNNTQPIIRGVETFQVLYGVDNVTAGLATALTTVPNVVTNYLRADQFLVPGNLMETQKNWGRVRNIRIGMVLRGPLGSSPVSSNSNTTYYPLGIGASASGGSVGSALSTASDPGSIFKPGSDTRLRQVVTFTIHLRNDQNV